jgi:hypothetical protein
MPYISAVGNLYVCRVENPECRYTDRSDWCRGDTTHSSEGSAPFGSRSGCGLS